MDEQREADRDDLIRLLGRARRPMSITDVCERLDAEGLDYSSQSTLARRLKQLERDGLCFQAGREGRILSPEGTARYRQLEEGATRSDLLTQVQSISTSEGLEQLLRIRRAVEPEAAREFAESATDEQIEELRATQALYREAVAPAGPHPRGAALGFHRHLATASNNPFVLLVLNEALHERTGRIEAAMDVVLQQQRTHESSVHFHDDIIDAIVRRDPVAAEESMRAHLDTLLAEIEQLKPGRDLDLLDSILEWSLTPDD
ncbi:FCD domain-containing protein [Agrococcus sp. ARC_14]|uniref:FadR/GntR family transcriptional regulator n=1 Tax=Agrococcus sp. ARC_14 TaxID=2919927 RepID=UPI001F06071C|nr:FCD domain-containing protein [Agrococcus sp. ARC_14]MCH1883978.1 FCD domain-containing protein [Agrococcus sp. ARC_14]